MTNFHIGDRVRARNERQVGTEFRGLTGTVAEITARGQYIVQWDECPEGWRDIRGGNWNGYSLERLPGYDEFEERVKTLEREHEATCREQDEKIEKLERRLRQANRRTEAAQHLYREQEAALLAEEKAHAAERQHLYSEINEHHAALEYVFTHLPEADQHRLAGFRDGYATRTNEDVFERKALNPILQGT